MMKNNFNLQDDLAFEIIPMDYSFYLMLLVAIVLSIIIIKIVFRTLKKEKQINKKTKEQRTLEALHKLDFNTKNHKQIAYDFTLFIKSLELDSSKESENILVELEKYKYQKENIQIDMQLQKRMKGYIDGISL